MLRSSYDVVVVGAGPVGVAAAAGFGQRGARVLLLEANPKASRRFAGEWVHPTGARILERLGLFPTEITASHAPQRGFAAFPDDGSDPVLLEYVPNPDGSKALGFTCEHGDLVEGLRASVASSPGVTYLPRARVHEIDGHTLRFKHEGDEHSVEAGQVVGADGRSSMVRKAIGGPQEADLVSHMAGLELRDVDLPFEGYGHVFLGGPGPVLLYRIGPRSARACIDLPADAVGTRRDARYLWDAFGPRFPVSLRPALRRALEEERLVWAANRFLPRVFYGREHVALVGDAVGFYHPLTASGITVGLKDVETLLASGDVRTFQRRREPQSFVPELLANALFQVFTREDESASALRSAVFDTWRDHPPERARTMQILAGEEIRLGQFGGAFVRVAMRAVTDTVSSRGVSELLDFAEWTQWPAATLVPSRIRRRVRELSSPLFPIQGLRVRPPRPERPDVRPVASAPEADVDALLASADALVPSLLSAPLQRARALHAAAPTAEGETLIRQARTVLLDLDAARDADLDALRAAVGALAAVRRHHPGLLTAAFEDAFTATDAHLRASQRPLGGFGSLRATALAIESLVDLGAPPFDPALRRAHRWLASQQREDGAFGLDGASTGIVVRALLYAHLPAWDRVLLALQFLGAQVARAEGGGAKARLAPEAAQAVRLYRDRRAERIQPRAPRRRASGEEPQREDWAWCQQSLLAVSRTFARPIQMLPGRLEQAVTCGYLLCRVADTIEDNAHLELAERDLRYATFLEALAAPAESAACLRFEGMWEGVEHGNAAELDLVKHLRRVMRVFRSLPVAMQTKTARWVAEMTRGMQLYSHRQPGEDGITALHTEGDLERYCYYVAGTVGHMLTDLFVEELAQVGTPVENALRTSAESFGLGLQLVNILKDVTDDRSRDVSYIPRTVCEAAGTDVVHLVDPERRLQAHAAVAPLFDRAQEHLGRALDYTLSIPADQTAIRLFCLLPLWMAVRTLIHGRGNDAMFVAGAPVKITRSEVEALIADCVAHAGDDLQLRQRYDALWRAPSSERSSSANVN